MTKIHKIAVAGFRHGHIFGLLDLIRKSPRTELVATCEEDAAAREEIAGYDVWTDYQDISRMLSGTDCDIVAIGDYYAKRGSIAIAALKSGHHVIADKPLCTTLAELDEIENLAKTKHLCVGCMFDLRSDAVFDTARTLILAGKIGKVTQIQFSAQHPLRRSSRPAWYFEPGKHGGTINDIAIHGIDLIPWMTGLEIDRPVAARTWKAFEPAGSCFNDAAQFMVTLENGCGVMADVSYAAPDSIGGGHPCYWRFNIWGTDGMLECKSGEKEIRAYFNGTGGVSHLALNAAVPVSYFDSFLNEIEGTPGDLNTESVIRSARAALELQALADRSVEK